MDIENANTVITELDVCDEAAGDQLSDFEQTEKSSERWRPVGDKKFLSVDPHFCSGDRE